MPVPGTAIPTNDSAGRVFHTLRSVREVSEEEMRKAIKKEKEGSANA